MRGERLDTGPAAAACRPWLLVAVLTVALVLVLAIVLQPNRTTPNPSLTPTPAGPTMITLPGTPIPVSTTPSSASQWQWASLDLLPTTQTWHLVGLTDKGLVTIDLAHHRIGRAIFAEFGGGDSQLGSLVPTPDGVVIQNGYNAEAYLVADDLSLRPLPTDSTARWFAGPDHGWPLWRLGASETLTIDTVDQSGKVRHQPVPDGSDAYTASSDGNGDLLLSAADGSTFRLTDHGMTRIATTPIVAVGPTLLLTIRCGDNGTCWYETVDQTGANARRVPGKVMAGVTNGVVSPDGHTVALTVSTGSAYQLTLLDLNTGNVREAGSVPDYVASLIWTPDSRYVVATLQQTNALYVADAEAATGRTVTLPFDAKIQQLVVDSYPRQGWG